MKRFEKNRKTIPFLCYLPMILFIGLLWNAASRQIHSQLFSTLADLARQNRYVVSYSINQKMEELERVAQGLAQREDFPQGVAIDDLATVANVLGFREIGVTGLDGMARMSTDTSYDITGREYFQMSVQGFNWVSKTLCDMRDGKKVNVCSVPVRSDSGAVIGTLLGTIETDEFFASMQVPSFHEQGYAYVVNQDGDVVLTTRSDGVEVTNFCTLLYQNPGNVDQLNQLRDCLAGKTESVNLLVNEDERHYINVSRLGYDDLWLVTGVPEHALDSGIMAQFIPSNAPHADAAYAFIDYILRPEVSKACFEYMGYYCTNQAADELIADEYKEFLTLPEGFDGDNTEMIQPISAEAEEAHVQVWTEFKNACGQ